MTAGEGGIGREDRRPRVAVIYHMFPHYRGPVLRALARSERYRFEFHGSHQALEGILPYTGDDVATVAPLGFRPQGAGGVFTGLWRLVLSTETDALILIGNPNYLQTWVAVVLARLRGKQVLFWTHGWRRREPGLKGRLRTFYYRLSNGVLVYADRAKEIARASGFPVDKVFPIYNSLDWDASAPLFEALERGDPDSLKTEAGLKTDCPVLICTARLTPLCRFDLLLEAAALLAARGRPVQVVLVGDGPMRPQLEAQAKAANLDVTFTGGIYDEAVLSRLLYCADMTVSPGKVGLTGMHSLTYGTPVVTHDDLDHQMPEVEAVIPGRTGVFFRENDAEDLARAIGEVLDWPQSRAGTRAACRAVIADRYTPAVQTRLIEDALDTVMGRGA